MIFFNNGTKGNHIGIYTSGNKMLHCYKGGGVKETDISYGGHLVGYGRLW
ncbi:MAG: NlpC/P60 family protein [Lachnospirales bacterium]